jgi:DNA invertase Pin-like site-specific DNA recombinase
MLIGYARVPDGDQTLNLQRDALREAGCDRIFEETAGGAKTDRPILKEVIAYARGGDVLVVGRLDRFGRSLQHPLTTITGLAEQRIGFKSVTEQIDTTTPSGKLNFHLFGS